MVESVSEKLLTSILNEAVERIGKKVVSGKKLTDTEITILLIDMMNRRQEIMEGRFNEIDKRLEDMKAYIDGRFNDVNKRFEDVDKRFNDVNRRFDEMKAYIDKRFEDVNRRFEDVNRRFEDVKHYVDKRIDDLGGRIDDLSNVVRAMSVEVSSIKTDVINLLKQKLL
ncbi:MAG: hypothetical protein ACP5IZ_02410 [Thermoprotei archaeon]